MKLSLSAIIPRSVYIPVLVLQKWSPLFMVFGDLGIHTQTIPTITEEALSGDYTAVFHIGDFAYNLHDHLGLVMGFFIII